MKNVAIARIDGDDAVFKVAGGYVTILKDDGMISKKGVKTEFFGKMDYSLNPDYAELLVHEPIVGQVYYYCIDDYSDVMIEGYSIWDGIMFVPLCYGMWVGDKFARFGPAQGFPIPPNIERS